MYPSYLSDAVSDLADAVLSLLRLPMGDEATCRWQDEPGEWRWILRRVGEEVEIEALRFEETFSPLPDERGERVFWAECSLLRLATQVKGQLHQLLNDLGEQSYLERWRHPFPMQTFRQLETAIQERKHTRK